MRCKWCKQSEKALRKGMVTGPNCYADITSIIDLAATLVATLSEAFARQSVAACNICNTYFQLVETLTIRNIRAGFYGYAKWERRGNKNNALNGRCFRGLPDPKLKRDSCHNLENIIQ